MAKKPGRSIGSHDVSVYRTDDGEAWEAYVMERDLLLLGTYPTKRAAVAARAKYWATPMPILPACSDLKLIAIELATIKRLLHKLLRQK